MKTAIIASMKLLAAFVLLPMMALGATVGPLPLSEFADTEVSTNLPFQVDFGTMSRIEFSFSMAGSPTNNVEVWIGADLDENGELSLDEADHVLGYDCGKWFHRDAVEDKITQANQTLNGSRPHIQRTFILKKRQMLPSWDLVKVVRRGVSDIGEVVLVEGKKPGIAVIVR